MRRTPLLIAITAAIGLFAGIAAAEGPHKPPGKRPDPGKADREREARHIRKQMAELERHRDELVGKKKLKENDPRVREIAEQLERFEHHEGERSEAEREREIDRLHEKIKQLERRREELVEKKGLKEDDPKVREIDEQIDELEGEIEELEGEEHERGPGVRGLGHPRPPSPELLERLEEELPKVQFEEDELGTVIDILRERHEINIHVDWLQLEEVAVEKDTLVTIDPLTDVPFETVLRLVLRSLTEEPDRVGFYVDGNVLIITRGELLPRPGRGPFPVEEVLERLQHERPEVHERLMALRREHPERFEHELARIAGPMPRPPRERKEAESEEIRRRDPERFELMKRNEELTNRTVGLAEEIRRAKEAEARGKMKDKLRELLNTQFEVRMQIRKLEIREIKRHLDELLAGLERRVRNKASLIERRMNQLLNPEETEW